MPTSCSSFRCKNRRTIQTRNQGITFHRFPKDPGLRRAWALAIRRKNFVPSSSTVLCSCHFNASDFDRTGQTVRLREGAVPSVFLEFPDHLKKVPKKTRSTRTSLRAIEASKDPVPAPVPKAAAAEPMKPSDWDHHYALDPNQIKSKLSEAQARVQELEKQLRNAKDRERRHRRTVKSLLDDLKDKQVISEDLQLRLENYSGD